MKKLTVIILSLLMIFVLAACGAKCEEHTFDNVCDTECNVCGAHRGIKHRFAPADCFNPATCEFCGATDGDPLGHTPVTDAAVPPTCKLNGLTEGSHCSVCDTVLVAQTEVPPLAHDYVDSFVTEPTCTESGYTTYICSCGCEYIVTDTPPTDHAWLDADCETPKTCDTCGATEGEPTEHEYADGCTPVEGGHLKECICHPELSEVLAHLDEDGDTVCDDCGYELNALYTVALDREHESVQIDFTSLADGSTYTVYTAANGTATASLPKGEYLLGITHYNSGYIWLDKDNSVTLTEDNNTYTAEFEVSTETIMYVLNVYAPDGEYYRDGKVLVYSPYGTILSPLAVNGIGQSITYLKNGDYVASVFAGGFYKTVRFVKDGPTTIDVYMDNPDPLGSAENPMLIFDLTNLPYGEDYIASLPFDNSYDFDAGESLYVLLPFADKKVVTLGTDKLTLECNGEILTPNENGEYRFKAAYGDSLILKLTATEACTENIIITQPGCVYHPIELDGYESFTHTEVIDFAAGESVYFYFFCYPDSTLRVTAPGATVTLDGGEMTETPPTGGCDICVTADEAGTYEIIIEYTKG